MLRGVLYNNNDTVLLSDIGERENALQCTTTQTDCCGFDENGNLDITNRRGQFYYPSGTQVPIRGEVGDDGLYRSRNYQYISLNRLSMALSAPPTGRYCCDIPDTNGMSQFIYINIGKSSY